MGTAPPLLVWPWMLPTLNDPVSNLGMFLTCDADFVLVYEEKTEYVQKRQEEKAREAKEGKRKLTKKEREKLSTEVKNELWREKYLENLKSAGLQMEEVGLPVWWRGTGCHDNHTPYIPRALLPGCLVIYCTSTSSHGWA